MALDKFIQANHLFLKRYSNHEIDGNLLIEDNSMCFLVHYLAIQALILGKAKNYKPLWLYSSKTPINLLKSYDPSAEQIKLQRLNLAKLIATILIAIIEYLKILINKDILSFKYSGVKYGDIVYDSYLGKKQVGTIRRIDIWILYFIFSCVHRHERIKKTIIKNNIKATLNSHRVGIGSGVMLRTALKCGCEVYTINGMNRGTLHRTTTIDKMIDYEYTPTQEEIHTIASLDENTFNDMFRFINNFHINGGCSADASYAFSKSKHLFTRRDEFTKKYNLDPAKKNIFIMLHAFTDWPHSHFKWMIFKDYADWFLRTLQFAKSNSAVNWIFKRHPSDSFYPITDIDFNKLFTDSPKNVVFLDENDQMSAQSLIYVADAVVTCLGSAGFEIPAMGGIFSVTAGDNHYWGYGFSYNPETEKDYFEILSNLKNVKRLTPEQQKQAKAVYMFIYYFCTVNYSCIPMLSRKEQFSSNINEVYWGKVLELYSSKKDIIYNEIEKYADEIRNPNFKAHRTLAIDLLEQKEGI